MNLTQTYHRPVTDVCTPHTHLSSLTLTAISFPTHGNMQEKRPVKDRTLSLLVGSVVSGFFQQLLWIECNKEVHTGLGPLTHMQHHVHVCQHSNVKQPQGKRLKWHNAGQKKSPNTVSISRSPLEWSSRCVGTTNTRHSVYFHYMLRLICHLTSLPLLCLGHISYHDQHKWASELLLSHQRFHRAPGAMATWTHRRVCFWVPVLQPYNKQSGQRGWNVSFYKSDGWRPSRFILLGVSCF